MRLEKMAAFFESRLEGYEEHMLNQIQSAREFYAFTAACLPMIPGTNVLDLGCGTGLELDHYYPLNPTAKITGIDLSEGMLRVLRNKYPHKDLTLIRGSYFAVPLGTQVYDAAVSVESLHHFTQEEKIPLYEKVRKALKKEGFFVLTDYFALSEEEEISCRQQLLRLMEEQKIAAGEYCHFDTPLTVDHEVQALYQAGFSRVEVLKNWGATYTIAAKVDSYDYSDRRCFSHGQNPSGAKAAGSIPLPISVCRPFENGADPQRADPSDPGR